MKRTSTVVLDSYRLAQYAQPLSCYICGEDNGFDWVRCRQCQAPLSLAQSTEKRRDVQLIPPSAARPVAKRHSWAS